MNGLPPLSPAGSGIELVLKLPDSPVSVHPRADTVTAWLCPKEQAVEVSDGEEIRSQEGFLANNLKSSTRPRPEGPTSYTPHSHRIPVR